MGRHRHAFLDAVGLPDEEAALSQPRETKFAGLGSGSSLPANASEWFGVGDAGVDLSGLTLCPIHGVPEDPKQVQKEWAARAVAQLR